MRVPSRSRRWAGGARPARGLTRSVGVLVLCVSLAGVSLAAAHGRIVRDPAAAVVAAAKAHLHDSYTWGATGPETWDCSGLTSVMWRTVGGVEGIPRTSSQQQAWTVPIPAEQALPGDLVFFGDPATHVGLVEHRTSTGAGTKVVMIDAASSRRGVVERNVWWTGTVRFGRVPRAGMVAVRPWRGSAPAVPAPDRAPAHQHRAIPALRVTAAVPWGRALLTGLPVVGTARSALAARAALRAQAYLGNRTMSDVDLVRSSWHRAGGRILPATQSRLVAAGRRVALRDARIGDLIFYGAPMSHVGMYLGNGLIIDASRSYGRVVIRPVWATSSVSFLRLPR